MCPVNFESAGRTRRCDGVVGPGVDTEGRGCVHDGAGHGVCRDGVEELPAPSAGRIVDAVDLDVALGADKLKPRGILTLTYRPAAIRGAIHKRKHMSQNQNFQEDFQENFLL